MTPLCRLLTTCAIALYAVPAFGAATVRIAHFATPAEPVLLTYSGVLANLDLPATLVYGQSTTPASAPAGAFTVGVQHQNTSVDPAMCAGELADGETKLLALSTLEVNGKPTLQCDVIDLKARLRPLAATAKGGAAVASPVAVTIVHLSATAGDGWLSAYAPGGAYTAPCTPTARSKSVAYKSQDTISLDVGRHDLAFVRMCSTTIDVPAVQDSVVVSGGHLYTVLVVPDGEGPRTVRLVLVTDKE